MAMKGTKRFRSGAWRLKVFAGWDPATGKRIDLYETVKAPNNRAGAKAADARLAEMVAAVESGERPSPKSPARARPSGMTVTELADRWEAAHRPRQNERTGQWIGWSPKTHRDKFRRYILPTIGDHLADGVTGIDLDDFYRQLEDESGLSPSSSAPSDGSLAAASTTIGRAARHPQRW